MAAVVAVVEAGAVMVEADETDVGVETRAEVVAAASPEQAASNKTAIQQRMPPPYF